MIRLIIVLIITGSLFGACSNNSKPQASSTQQSIIVPNDFLDFLEAFHSDIAFQKAHIQWPLQGLPTMMDGRDTTITPDAYRWTKEEWVMHHGFDENNEEFEQTYTMVGDDIIIEKILHINGTMGMERRFSRHEDSWMMIFYAGMNLIRQ